MKRDPLPTTQRQLPAQSISDDVLQEKYFKPGEHSLEQLYGRVARALASVEKPELRAEWESRFLANLHAGAIGAGRIMSAAGTDIQATLINCFVQPVGDCIQGVDDEGFPGILKPCARPPKPCAAAVAWATIFRASGPRAPRSRPRHPWLRARAAT